MVFLTSCWFIIEKVLIPDGFVKLYCLSYFIHPFSLLFFQIFVWVEGLIRCILVIVSCIVSFFHSLGGYMIKCLKGILFYVHGLFDGGERDEFFDSVSTDDTHDAITTDNLRPLSLMPVDDQELQSPVGEDFTEEVDFSHETVVELDEAVEREVYSENDMSVDDESYAHVGFNLSSPESSLGYAEYEPSDFIKSPSLDIMDSPIQDHHFRENSNWYYASAPEMNLALSEGSDFDDPNMNSFIDPFYLEYLAMMSWFDMLNHERTCELGAILKEHTRSFNIKEPFQSFISSMSWQKIPRKMHVRSMENDFEIVYVAQLCLSWEALHHQYKAVEEHLANSSTQHGFFYTNVAGEFQNFHVLLDRFMEDERYQGKRYLNYIQRRISDTSLLQVPQLSGFYEEAKHGTMGEAMNDARQVLKAIEECVKTYWEFVKTDNKYFWWKLKSKLWTSPPVVDPIDLDLLEKLNRMLKMKEILYKDLLGKEKCWCNKKSSTSIHVGDFEARKEMMFTMINLKLVRRVLNLCAVSRSQLNWCKEKLNSIMFMGSSVTTNCFARPLFPLETSSHIKMSVTQPESRSSTQS